MCQWINNWLNQWGSNQPMYACFYLSTCKPLCAFLTCPSIPLPICPSNQHAYTDNVEIDKLKSINYSSLAWQEPEDVSPHPGLWTEGPPVRHHWLPGHLGQTHHQKTQRHWEGCTEHCRAGRGVKGKSFFRYVMNTELLWSQIYWLSSITVGKPQKTRQRKPRH